MKKTASAKKLQTYIYEGRNLQGDIIKGEYEAENINAVRSYLRQEKIIAKTIKKRATSIFGQSTSNHLTEASGDPSSQQADKWTRRISHFPSSAWKERAIPFVRHHERRTIAHQDTRSTLKER